MSCRIFNLRQLIGDGHHCRFTSRAANNMLGEGADALHPSPEPCPTAR